MTQAIDGYAVIDCWDYGDGIHLELYCPHCRDYHYHGLAGGGGHRQNHCNSVRGRKDFAHGYILRLIPRPEQPQRRPGCIGA
jgi:hypothetical protein